MTEAASDWGLSAETVQRIRDVFSRHPAVAKVLLYGSRAQGNYRRGSDIDLTMQGPNLTESEFAQITNQLDDLLLPYKIDLSLFSRIENEDLIEHINRVGVVFYSAPRQR